MSQAEELLISNQFSEKNDKEFLLAKKILSTIEIQKLLNLLGEEIKFYFKADSYLITLSDIQKTNLVIEKIEFSKELQGIQEVISQLKYPFEVDDPFTAAYNKKTIIELSSDNLSHYSESVKSRFRYWKIKHGYVIPFLNQQNGEILGTLFVFNHNQNIEKVAIQSFYDVLFLFFEQIKNAKQFAFYKERERQLKTSSDRNEKVFELAEKINNLTSIELIYQLILESTLQLYGFDIGLIFMDNGSMIEYISGLSKPEKKLKDIFSKINQYFKDLKGYEKNVTDGATSLAFLRNNHFYFLDINHLLKLPMAEKDQKGIEILGKPQSLLIMPILKNQKPVGVFQFWSIDKKVVLSETDLQKLLILNGFIGSAIANSKVYSLVEKQKKEVEEKNKIIQQKNRQLIDELKLAREIQVNLVPSKMPEMQGVKIAAYYKPMEEVGGDFYDFIPFRDNEKLGIFISDVSGHGVPAALIASMVKTLMETAGEQRNNPAEMLQYINQKITGLTGGNFLTAFYALYDSKEKKLSFARGAHNPPILIRGNQLIELSSKGKILGIDRDNIYEQKEIDLFMGDKILFYTDGLTDAINNQDIMFEDLLPQVLMKHKEKLVEEYLESIYHALVSHKEGIRFEDDVCLLVMEITQ